MNLFEKKGVVGMGVFHDQKTFIFTGFLDINKFSVD